MGFRTAALVSVVAASLTAVRIGAQFSSNDAACTRTYTVIAGDTCDRIGQKTWTSTYQIIASNLGMSGELCYGLEIGSVSTKER